MKLVPLIVTLALSLGGCACEHTHTSIKTFKRRLGPRGKPFTVVECQDCTKWVGYATLPK